MSIRAAVVGPIAGCGGLLLGGAGAGRLLGGRCRLGGVVILLGQRLARFGVAMQDGQVDLVFNACNHAV